MASVSIVQTVTRQLDRIGPEGVGLEDLRAGLDVGFVDFLHQRRAG